MLQAIERTAVIPMDGRLPNEFSPAFGHKARIIVLIEDQDNTLIDEDSTSTMLMGLAGKIESLKTISDPVAWQKKLRNEWEKGL